MPMPVAHFCMKKYPAKKSPSDRRPVSLCEASTTSAIIDEERIIRMIENVLLTHTSPNIHATLGLAGRPGKNTCTHAKYMPLLISSEIVPARVPPSRLPSRSDEQTSALQSQIHTPYAVS